MESKKSIFLSHSSQDNSIARATARALEQCGFTVWYDEKDLGYGDLRKLLEDALRSVQIFAVLLSRAALASIWVNREIDAALELEKQQPGFLIVPMLIEEDCPVPLLLSRYRRLDFTYGSQWAELQKFVRALCDEKGEWAPQPLSPPLPSPAPASPTHVTNFKIGNIKARTVTINQADKIHNELNTILKEQAKRESVPDSAQDTWPVSPERTALLLEMMITLLPQADDLPETLREQIRSMCRQAHIASLI
ncbi:MAG TPA: toll/interleukin-1 receptor domain-containing protein [Ktedonobacterales bacterium]|nr:toll/interleukin-1 receptor domain-containing protein [Ktedonobacterales bacterium]